MLLIIIVHNHIKNLVYVLLYKTVDRKSLENTEEKNWRKHAINMKEYLKAATKTNKQKECFKFSFFYVIENSKMNFFKIITAKVMHFLRLIPFPLWFQISLWPFYLKIYYSNMFGLNIFKIKIKKMSFISIPVKCISDRYSIKL